MSDLLNRIDLRFDFVQNKLSMYKVSPAGCWEYQGGKNKLGYGEFKIYVNEFVPQKRKFRANRVAYAFFHGVDPGELFVCHHCDNPSCINPDHLFLGTPLDNTRDMHEKGRAPSQQGAHNNASKITEAIVIEVVAQIRAGKSNVEIARELPISHYQVSRIRLGKSWIGLLDLLEYDPDEHRVFKRKAG